MKKSEDLSNFCKLSNKQRKAVKMLFEGEETNSEIAKKLHIGETTFYKWKNDSTFVKARQEYSVYKLDTVLPLATRKLIDLIKNGKSEMVRLQAIQTVFKRLNLLSDNSTPELDQAKIRKANADARVAEARAKAMEDNGQDMELLLDKMLNTLTKEDENNGNK